jgi:transposase
LRRILDRRALAYEKWRAADDALVQAILDVREREGISVRALAEALGVGASTIQDWTRHARQERDGHDHG